MSAVSVVTQKLTSKAIIDHLVSSVNDSAAYDEPYSHFYAENCFPPELYSAMISQLPEGRLYHPMNHRDAMQADGTSTRGYLPLDEEAELSRLDAEQRELWSAIVAALRSPQVKKAVFSRLQKDLAVRFGINETDVGRIRTDTKVELLRDVSGYKIKVHPDSTQRVVTLQFYLATDMSQRELGTSIYQRHSPGFWRSILYSLCQVYRLLPQSRCRRLKNWLFDRGNSQFTFSKVRTHEFTPNTAGAFAVSAKSWHGRDELGENSGVRNSLLMMYMLPESNQS